MWAMFLSYLRFSQLLASSEPKQQFLQELKEEVGRDRWDEGDKIQIKMTPLR